MRQQEHVGRSDVFAPRWVGEVELGSPLSVQPVLAPPGPEHRQALLLVRFHGVPIGYASAPIDSSAGIDLGELAGRIAAEHGAAITRHLSEDGEDPGGDPEIADRVLKGLGEWCPQRGRDQLPPFSVALCSHDRPELVRRALSQLARLEYPDYEVLLVDNAPSDGRTRDVFHEVAGNDARFRYLLEERKGLSRARNRALREARHRLVAFTDDDAQADPGWLEALARGFARDPLVGCVTGLVPSAQLDTPAQEYFHGRVWWSSTLAHRMYERTPQAGDSPLHPFRIGMYGTGANFAVERDLALAVGGFNELIGAGSPSGGGAEDGDMFVRVLNAGRKLSYEPAAIIWHRARPTDAELRQQLEEYGKGIFVTGMSWLTDRSLRREALRRVPAAVVYYLGLLWHRGVNGEGGRAPMALTELRGALLGPLAFVRGSLVLRRENAAYARSSAAAGPPRTSGQ